MGWTASAAAAANCMDVVYLGHQNYHVTRTARQHLLPRLAARGVYRILHVDPDPGVMPPGERGTGFGPLLRQERPGLWLLTPRGRGCRRTGSSSACSNGVRRRFHARLGAPPEPIRRPRVGGALRRLGFHEPVAVVSRPIYEWDRLGFAPSGRLYYAEDEWTALGRRLARRRRRHPRPRGAAGRRG